MPAPDLAPTGLAGSGETAVLPVLPPTKNERPFGRWLDEGFLGSASLGFEELPFLSDFKLALVASEGLEHLSPGSTVVS